MKLAGNDDREFGMRLRAIMEMRGLSVIDLHNITGISRGSIMDYRNARTSPNIPTLRILRDGLNCTWDALLGYGKLGEDG